MQEIDLLSLEEATKKNRLVYQLFCLKRCFGPSAALGIVVGHGIKTDRCKTVSQLVEYGHVAPGMEWIDEFLSNVPRVSVLPDATATSITNKRADGGPPCPWDVARIEMEAAKQRVVRKRANRLRMKPTTHGVYSDRYGECCCE